MKYFGLILALIVLGFTAKAQYLQKPKPTIKGLSTEKGLSFYSNSEYKLSEKPFTQRSPEKLESPASQVQVKRLPPDQMPNLQPMGIFPSRNLIPDNTTQYSLIITDPTKIRISKGPHDKVKE